MSYSAKELTRDMQKPTEQSMTNLKRLGRYLKKRPRLVPNVSDALTKPLDEKRMTNMLTMMGDAFKGGHTALAPEAQ